MADTINLYAESGRNIIGDDSSPTLTLENTSSGAALKLVASGTGQVLETVNTATSSPTVAVLTVTNSVASGAFFEFKGFLASIASASSLQRGVRVKVGDEYGWMPIYFGGVFT